MHEVTSAGKNADVEYNTISGLSLIGPIGPKNSLQFAEKTYILEWFLTCSVLWFTSGINLDTKDVLATTD
jgi:hypothetical protein